MTLLWLVAAFWLMLAIDYLPVRLGTNEMPRSARLAMLTITGLGTLWVVFWYLLRRVFFAFQDSSLAILIERQFPEFRDSLTTTVQMRETLFSENSPDDQAAIEAALSGGNSGHAARMLQDTVRRAETNVAGVQLGRIFNYEPLTKKILSASLAVCSLVLLGAWGGNTLKIGAKRLIALSDQEWPRRAQIKLVDFDHQERKIAKGTDAIIRVQADATLPYPPPELCVILYRTADGETGRVNMSRDGEPVDGYQNYVFSGKPFKAVLSDIQLDVIGSDHRLRDNWLRAVPSPVVTKVVLNSRLPSYLDQDGRVESWNPGVQLPIGTEVTASISANKSLRSATAKDIDSGDEIELSPGKDQNGSWTLDLGTVNGRKAVSISLRDTDGIESLEPHLLTIGAVEDVVPQVDVSLRGIGRAITPQAVLPVVGTIRDDYEVKRTWFEIKLGDAQREFDFLLQDDQPVDGLSLDFRAEASADKETPLQLQPDDRLVFSVKASDKYDLNGEKHVGSNEARTLNVVRSEDLLAILDARELGLRRRFEQIRREMVRSRESLARLRASFKETEENEVDPEVDNLARLRERWASWARQRGEQSSTEIVGITLAFEVIREELVNNRVDSQERKSRMDGQIIGPLQDIGQTLFPAWKKNLSDLQLQLENKNDGAEALSVIVLGGADQILVAMDEILDKMLELEDYTELVNIVRQIIEQQQRLLKKTQTEQAKGVLDFLE